MSASQIAKQRLSRSRRTADGLKDDPTAVDSPDMGPYATEYTHQYNTRAADLMPTASDFDGRLARMVPQKRYEFRSQTKGIIPGYKGHIPATKDVMGTSPFGQLTTEPDLKPEDARDILARAQTVGEARPGSPPRPHRLDRRGIIPGATYHVHQERFE
eukprot:2031117-Prymnesium_polylepis.1